VIEVKTFVKPASDCQNYFEVDFLDHSFVDLNRVVNECEFIVHQELPMKTTSMQRVPPLVLMRFARGGKTITLSKLFDKLKEVRLDGVIVNPILITLNENGPRAFERRVDETQAQTILRLIAAQLGEYTPEQTLNLVVDRKALDIHLGNNVVLLIDELNNLSDKMPLDPEAGKLLREMFLDKAGRYLVFSSHFPISIEGNKVVSSDFLGIVNSTSARGIVTVNMSLASTLKELRDMSHVFEALTEEAAAWYGYIPSLIYSTMKYGALTPKMRFQETRILINPSDNDVFQRFVMELISGERDLTVAKYYGEFASVGVNLQVAYPLCYVKEIFKHLSIQNSVIQLLLKVLTKLEIDLESKHSGLAWECTVQVAIILQMLKANWFGSQGPFDIVPLGAKPDLAFRTLPDECNTLANAKVLIDSIIAEYRSPTLIYVVSANASFPEVEGFVVYTSGCLANRKKQVTYKKLKILTFRSAHSQQLIIIIVVSGAVSIVNKIIF
jgi:hypothetical protein